MGASDAARPVVAASPVVASEAGRGTGRGTGGRHPAARRAGDAAGATEGAPAVVHVSIGRIDVRAATPAPRTPPLAPPTTSNREPAGLSLGDYLRGQRAPR